MALQVNIHYTDGDAPYLNGEKAIATDGIRIQYTPTLRPKTATSTPVINVGFGPPAMFVEPNKKRACLCPVHIAKLHTSARQDGNQGSPSSSRMEALTVG